MPLGMPSSQATITMQHSRLTSEGDRISADGGRKDAREVVRKKPRRYKRFACFAADSAAVKRGWPEVDIFTVFQQDDCRIQIKSETNLVSPLQTVTVTSSFPMSPLRLCRLAVFSIKPNVPVKRESLMPITARQPVSPEPSHSTGQQVSRNTSTETLRPAPRLRSHWRAA